MKYPATKPVLQATPDDCGVAALLWTLRSVGVPARRADIATALRVDRWPRGSLPHRVWEVVRNADLPACALWGAAQVAAQVESGGTAVVLTRIASGPGFPDHWVAVRGSVAMDPLSGYAPAEDYLPRAWFGVWVPDL